MAKKNQAWIRTRYLGEWHKNLSDSFIPAIIIGFPIKTTTGIDCKVNSDLLSAQFNITPIHSVQWHEFNIKKILLESI